MVRVLFGDKNVGVQGIYYFETHDEAIKFSSKVAPFLESLRNGTEYWKEFMEEWKHENLLYNFLRMCKERVKVEYETPEVWWEPGGRLYGEKWHNEELPNGKGKCYLGDKLIEKNDNDSETAKDDNINLKLCLYKLANKEVITEEEYESIWNRIESKERIEGACDEFIKRIQQDIDCCKRSKINDK